MEIEQIVTMLISAQVSRDNGTYGGLGNVTAYTVEKAYAVAKMIKETCRKEAAYDAG